ncbi:hypothetical protein COX00_03080 [Candidatus Uhrbacteria bacterium CG22_combo_CG10-13_8_21_14_all_47_17]|uniref:Uncharacterized protein n=1 Tax=Candidatus Uhrbacteria bacterium CG22_combo_CG10-13_8_21_14_all_47_17 TaxID=1975041 RepID=A0A2H0BRY8_9BACT|nr:MAG: hypothetical protein COX00_03080 [Candidatus Uhrbacteria bacterium CG22_combo_CG10-13_8_21_14_all_47_17]
MQKNVDARNVIAPMYAGPLFTATTALAAFAIDLITKNILFAKPALMTGFSFFFNLAQFTDFKNFGISFNIPLPLPLTVFITLAVVISLLLWLKKERPGVGIMTLGAGLLIGGALANLFDRVTLGYVRDWLLLWNRSAINLADLSVLTGILFLWRFYKPKDNASAS